MKSHAGAVLRACCGILDPVINLSSDDPVSVAVGLLGMALRVRSPDGDVTVRITETEAYHGEADPASHAYRGPSRRNRTMFGPAGRLYVYRSHGLHWCCNVVTGSPGVASAVLLRAGAIVEGEGLAVDRRGPDVPLSRLASGPGNFTKALGITGLDDGEPLTDGRLLLTGRACQLTSQVRSGPRVGVSQAAEMPWRFWLAGEPSVSAYRRSPRASRA